MKNEDLLKILKNKYPKNQRIPQRINDLYYEMKTKNLSDKNSDQRLKSDDIYVYWQQLSEILIYDLLNQQGFTIIRHSSGPDFLIQSDARRIWVEVITPTPSDLPEQWINHQAGTAFEVPHEKILLRWTAAINEKNKKLEGYLKSGIVQNTDICVIAVNSYLLRRFPNCWPEHGLSQFPFAVEAVFGVGPLSANIVLETMSASDAEHTYRSEVRNKNGSVINTNRFDEDSNRTISAIWGLDISENALVNTNIESSIVHNSKAANPLPVGLLPAMSEFTKETALDGFTIQTIEGRLAR